MLHQSLIEQYAQELKIAPLNIIREYMEVEMLNSFSQSKLSEAVVFYGGTALRLAYHSMRFSEDLDFLFIKSVTGAKRMLTHMLETVIRNHDGVTIEDVYEKRYTVFGLLHITHPLLKHAIRLKVEISKKQNGISGNHMLLTSPTAIAQPLIYTADLQSLQRAKLFAIKNRVETRDWFDLWYINQRLKSGTKPKATFPFNQREFSNELKRWLPQDAWKVIPNITAYYEKN